jgi:hypothetical protein
LGDQVVDYFKPVDGASWCDMLTSHNQHVWSQTGLDGGWVAPTYASDAANNGGSADDYPKNNVGGDARAHLSFWGGRTRGGSIPGRDSTYSSTGGCCATSTGVYSTREVWDKPFTLSYGVIDLPPPPPNTALTLVANVSSTTRANDTFWDARCGAIPDTALYARLVMGAVSASFLS